MTDPVDAKNLLFQSEQHPLVPLEFDSPEGYCLSLIHRKAYSRAAEIAKGLDVLDLGCNNGYGTMKIAERCARITGVDVSRNAIEAAIATHSQPNIEYRVVKGGRLPFKEKSFDLVTSFQVIEHVDQVSTYLREIRRVLRDSGKAVFTTPNRCIRLYPGQKPWNPFHVREYEAAEFRRTLLTVFSNVSVEGLFAVPELYKVEIERAGRAKRATRPSSAARLLRFAIGADAGNAIIHIMKAMLPDTLVLRHRETSPGPIDILAEGKKFAALSDFIARWSLDDLFYGNLDLNKALDLIAICSIRNSDILRSY